MNCEEFHARLSEYLDQSLDAISSKSIEVHLAACPLCRTEAAGLTDCIRQLAALPSVDPPLGFAQRVMAHVSEIEHRPSIRQRLFFPLKIKVPIHATAVVLIGALAFILSQKQEQLRDRREPDAGTSAVTSMQPTEQQSETRPESTIARERNVQDKISAEPATKRAVSPRQFVDQAPPEKVRAPASVNDQKPATPAANLKSDSESSAEIKKEAPRRPAIQAQEVSTGRDVLRPSVDRFGVGAAAGGLSEPSLRAAPLRAERSLSPLGELSADIEFVVRRHPPERRDQLSTFSSDTAPSAVAKRSAAPAAATPSLGSPTEIRWFSVQSDLYNSFKKELAAEASIESEKATGFLEKDARQKTARELLIKVIILSPADR